MPRAAAGDRVSSGVACGGDRWWHRGVGIADSQRRRIGFRATVTMLSLNFERQPMTRASSAFDARGKVVRRASSFPGGSSIGRAAAAGPGVLCLAAGRARDLTPPGSVAAGNLGARTAVSPAGPRIFCCAVEWFPVGMLGRPMRTPPCAAGAIRDRSDARLVRCLRARRTFRPPGRGITNPGSRRWLPSTRSAPAGNTLGADSARQTGRPPRPAGPRCCVPAQASARDRITIRRSGQRGSASPAIYSVSVRFAGGLGRQAAKA